MTPSSGIEDERDFFGDFLRIVDVTLDFNLCDSSKHSYYQNFYTWN